MARWLLRLSTASLVFGLVLVPSGAVVGAEPVRCGAVLTEDTVLDRDLVGCREDGLVIGADGITVDLNGHTVTGLGAAETAGVRNRGHDHVVIENGTVQDFGRGVLLADARRNLLRDLRVEVNQSGGVVLVEATKNRVVDCFAAANGGSPPSSGIALFDSDRNRIEGNVAFEHAYGIGLFDSDGNVLSDNDVAPLGSDGNNDAGIVVVDSSDNRIRDNRADSNDGDGIRVMPTGQRTSITGNLTRRNGDDGIDANSPRARIGGNVANNNGDLGIAAVSGVRDARGNRASGNGDPRQCVGVRCT